MLEWKKWWEKERWGRERQADMLIWKNTNLWNRKLSHQNLHHSNSRFKKWRKWQVLVDSPVKLWKKERVSLRVLLCQVELSLTGGHSPLSKLTSLLAVSCVTALPPEWSERGRWRLHLGSTSLVTSRWCVSSDLSYCRWSLLRGATWGLWKTCINAYLRLSLITLK